MNAWMTRVRGQWMVLAMALVVLAGALVAWSLSNASDRIGVVRVVRDVRSGQVFTDADFAVAHVAIDASVTGLVPESSMHRLVGRVAAVDLASGVLVQRGVWRDAPALFADERAVGVVLKPGRAPGNVGRGAMVQVASFDAASTNSPVAARVLDSSQKDDGTSAVELAVPAADAVQVAQWSANDALVLVVLP
jgi:hypothetical protein